jgi:hypothetical protein
MKFFMFLHLVIFAAFGLTGCSGGQVAPTAFEVANFDSDPELAQKLMCIEENTGITRHSRAYLEQFCPQIKTQLELVCFRFIRNWKEYRKACPGIDTLDKLECLSVVLNGAGTAEQASVEKCRAVTNRRQVLCLSKKVAKSGVALLPEVVQACLDSDR